jgi:cytochrome o ubiquinol oxidase subunit 3
MTAQAHAAVGDYGDHGHHDVHELREFGFWIYLMSDAIIFALLFATFVVMADNTAGGPGGHSLFSLRNTAAETALLLFSSITFGFAMLAVKAGARGGVILWLLVTVLFGAGFVALEINEFVDLIGRGAGPDRSGFLSSFFTLVGTHGLHVSVGIMSILVMAGQVAVKGLNVPVASRLTRLGMFWHFLDVIWIGIFSVVYLPGIL